MGHPKYVHIRRGGHGKAYEVREFVCSQFVQGKRFKKSQNFAHILYGCPLGLMWLHMYAANGKGFHCRPCIPAERSVLGGGPLAPGLDRGGRAGRRGGRCGGCGVRRLGVVAAGVDVVQFVVVVFFAVVAVVEGDRGRHRRGQRRRPVPVVVRVVVVAVVAVVVVVICHSESVHSLFEDFLGHFRFCIGL